MGSTLPEDTSREGGGVEVQGWRRGAGRQLGRLGAIKKNNDSRLKTEIRQPTGPSLGGGGYA